MNYNDPLFADQWKSEDPRVLFRVGMDAYKDGELEKAVMIWEFLLEADPNHSRASKYLTKARERLGVELKAKSPAPRGEKAQLPPAKSEASTSEQAQTSAETAMPQSTDVPPQLEPAFFHKSQTGDTRSQEKFESLFHEGVAKASFGQLEEAIVLWEQSLQIEPGNQRAVRCIQQAREKLQEGTEKRRLLDEAQACFEQERWTEVFSRCLLVLAQQPSHEEALELLERAKTKVGRLERMAEEDSSRSEEEESITATISMDDIQTKMEEEGLGDVLDLFDHLGSGETEPEELSVKPANTGGSVQIKVHSDPFTPVAESEEEAPQLDELESSPKIAVDHAAMAAAAAETEIPASSTAAKPKLSFDELRGGGACKPFLQVRDDELTSFYLSPEQGFVLSQINGATSARELAKISAISEPRLVEMLLEFRKLGIVGFPKPK